MKYSRVATSFVLAVTLLCGVSSPVHGQGAGTEWETLNQEVMELYRSGKYERAIVLAKKTIEVAEQNVGPDHPDVATSLENLADLYRATKRTTEADALEERAARIRAIKR